MFPYQLTILIPWLVLISMPFAANSPMVSTFRSKCKTRHATISDNQAKNLQTPIHPIQIVYTILFSRSIHFNQVFLLAWLRSHTGTKSWICIIIKTLSSIFRGLTRFGKKKFMLMRVKLAMWKDYEADILTFSLSSKQMNSSHFMFGTAKSS